MHDTDSSIRRATQKGPSNRAAAAQASVVNRHTADYNSREDDSVISVWQIVSVLRRWWWLIALITMVITAATTVVLFRMTPIFKATSLLEVRQEERNVVDVSEVESVIVDREFLTTQVELLKSQSLIEDTIESLNLLSDPYLANLEDEQWVQLPREQRLLSVSAAFERNLNVVPVARSLLIRISFDHSNPRKAAVITNTLTENFINNGLARKFNATAFAREFLEDRLKTVRASLETAERKLVTYATENNIIILDGENAREETGSLDIIALKTLNAELTTARVERASAEAAYSQVERSNFGAEVLSNDALSRLKDKRIELNSEYLEKQSIYKPGFPEMIELKGRIDLFDQEIAQKTQQIIETARAELKREFDQAVAKERDLSARVAALKGSVVDTRDRSIDYNILKRQVETERTQYEALLQRLKEVSVADDLGSNLVEVVDVAKTPKSPYKPNRLFGIFLSLALGGVIGLTIASLIELFDDKVKDPEDVKRKLGQVIMGVIPVGKNPESFLDELSDPRSTLAEAYASLRTNLQYSGPDGGPRIIQVTSTRSGEGKSVTSLATALRFAGAGHKILLIDADMRLPTFLQDSANPSIGLSGILTSRAEFADEIRRTKVTNLDLLTSGPPVPNPSEILSSGRFDALLDYAADNYDYVIVDSPPVLGIADAPVIGAKVDGTLLIVQTGLLRSAHVTSVIERLQGSKTKLLGVVLTKYKAQQKGYMDYYQYTYGEGASQYSADNRKKTKEHKAKRKFSLTE